MNKQKLLIVSLIFFFSNEMVFSQIEYFSKSHKIYLEEDNIIEEIVIKGKVVNKDGDEISIPYNSLEKITDLKLEYFDKKIKKLKQKDFILTSLASRNFYDGVKSLKYYIEKPSTFTLKYKITRNDLMYISTLDFYTYYKCDSILYELEIPNDKLLFYNLPFDIENLKIDSTEIEKGKRYTFLQNKNTHEAIVDLKINNSTYVESNYKSRVVRILISGIDNPQKSFNDWYLKLVESTGELNEFSKREIDSLLIGITSNEGIEKTLFKFVQEKIRYLDIEDGINAFVPRNVNDILSKRQGDCKDMSNLLVKAYNYKGLKAHIALSSSLSHRLELDFPNIASANHVVCVVKKNAKWLVFDATDKYCNYSNPSSHTQGRNIFIIDKEKGIFYRIKQIDFKHNRDSTYSELKFINDKLFGTVEMFKNGLSNRKFVAFHDYYSEKSLDEKLKKLILKSYNSYDVDSLKYVINSSSSIFRFNITERTTRITKVKEKIYLPIRQLIDNVHPFPKSINNNERIITYEAINKKNKILLELDSDFNLIKQLDASFSKDPFSFSFKIKKLPENKLMVEFEMIIKEVEIKGQDVETYLEFNEMLNSTLNKSIVYVNK
jgi:hypothetical protein